MIYHGRKILIPYIVSLISFKVHDFKNTSNTTSRFKNITFSDHFLRGVRPCNLVCRQQHSSESFVSVYVHSHR